MTAGRRLLLSPDQLRREHRQKLDRRILDQPAEVSEEAFRRGALRFFLRCFKEREASFLSDLRELLSLPEPLTLHALEGGRLRDLSDRYHLPPTVDVAIECTKTLLMWQAFPPLRDVWHFELPEGAVADPMGSAGSPYPFFFVGEGWNPETEVLEDAKKRLLRQFKAALNGKAGFWKSAEIDNSELRLFEDSPSLEKTRRNLECLAEKQASPKLSIFQLGKRLGLTKEAMRVGLLEAAALIGLPRIRSAPAGFPKGGQRKSKQRR